ncbi:MAG: YbaK/EbsC family protein [Candidatus Woesearchaeota archaeon]|jgi:prolyl-tRNA editing enzyme YbaK/EbsC (Cys-tRNA(Pro) deacylase)|nr:YbaK/EbsC family protein [Candidatus Woesearchaeota archaeon]MDP7182082.1 YbaK/EbsC family protein [Candidatus Woesearchaeota archaeon]MDP7198712.1 YbaK/EbsC family protein [Candidatus Woesearchaeota archaeon]MDP7467686.1 YbaK/EbsC family protein [Candidatus Woesearchaeota archaeon]MDP7647255.1 YbaK/EbsC family protein [Candidatus Woesearchaeota archaeon]
MDALADFIKEHNVQAELLDTDHEVKTVQQSADRGMDPATIIKSLLFIGEKPILVLVRGDCRADEAKLAQHYPNTHFANANEVRKTTAYGPGDVPPLLEGEYERVMDEKVAAGTVFECGGGKEKRHLRITVKELQRVQEWKVLDVST